MFVGDVFVREEGVALEHHAQIPISRLFFVDDSAVDPDFPIRGVFKSGNHP